MKILINGLAIVTASLILWFSFQGPAFPAETATQGRVLYESKCAICHGKGGKGDGPSSKALGLGPSDLTAPVFWKRNGPEKVKSAIEDGFGAMPAVDASPQEISAIVDYVSKAFRPTRK